MRKIYSVFCLVALLMSLSNWALAQSLSLKGMVRDQNQQAIAGAVVSVIGTSQGTVTDVNGAFNLKVEFGGKSELSLQVSLLGYEKTKVVLTPASSELLEVVLKSDRLGLKETVVTGVANPRSRLESSVSVSSLRADAIQQTAPRTTAEIFRSIPGIRSEASAGEGNTNITVRGVPISSGGSKYLQLQEDGLPVLQFGDIAFATADIFLRADQSISRIEAIRGGSASTMSSNAPAGIINFISKTGEVEGGSVAQTVGLDFQQFRTDFDYGSPIAKNLSFHVGGFVRQGEGVRTTGFNAHNGGQLKASLTKRFDNGYVRLYMKLLNDRAAAYMPMPIEVSGTNANPTYRSMAGFDALRGSLHSPYLLQNFGLGANGEPRRANVSDGMHPTSTAIGAELSFDLENGWSIENRSRFSMNSGRFLAPFPASVGSLSSQLATMGNAKGWGPLANANVTYADNGQAFTGNNAMLIHMFDTELKNFNLLVNDLRVKKSLTENTQLTLGWYNSAQTIDMAWLWNSYLSEVNGNGARLLNVDTNGIRLTQNGQFAYGVPVWGNCCQRSYNTQTLINAPYMGVAFTLDKFNVDASVRYDLGQVNGSFAGSNQKSEDMNGDGQIQPAEASVSVINHAAPTVVNYQYNYLSYSVGANYSLNNSSAIFARYSTGASAKADRILFTSSILPNGDARATYDQITQAEVGYKLKTNKAGLFVTGFFANVNEQGGYEATTQLIIENDYRSMGLEIEGSYAVTRNLDLTGSVTLTNATITSGANENNQPRRQSPVIFTLMSQYKVGKHSFGLNFIGSGNSFAQDDNKLVMPGYVLANAFVNFGLSKRLFLSVNGNNLLNTLAITESEEGSIAENSTNIIRARSLMGRSISATLRFIF